MQLGENQKAGRIVPLDVELNLIVLYVDDLQLARWFYATLGCPLQSERHGSGPEHYSAELNGTVFELYPRDHHKTGVARIGFRVRSVDQTIAALRGQNAKVLSEPASSPWGRRAVVEDLMGNRVELTEAVNG